MTARTAARRAALLASTLIASLAALRPAQAQDAGTAQRMNAIEAQIRALEGELRTVRRDLAARDSQLRAAQRDAARAREETERAQTLQPGGPLTIPGGSAPGGGQIGAGQQNASTTPRPTPKGSFQVGSVTVTLGGFIEGALIYRSRNEVADIASNFNSGIPFRNSPLYHQGEFRESARQSRLSLLAEGEVDSKQKLTAYFETDFQGAAPTSNSNESNSYVLRLRQAYGTYDNNAWGLHVLAGQAWSLLTPQKTGITPRQEDIPLTIDAQYVVGFNWTRQPQLRVYGDFLNHKLWAGISFENPQTVYSIGPNGAGTLGGATATFQNTGGSSFAPTVNYSTDIAPDVIAKVAADPGFGHYEIYGILRFLHDRVSVVGDGRNNTAIGGGGGASAIIPIIRGKLELHGNVLAGYGIGRYGSGQLPDATLAQSGAPIPLPEIEALGGLIAHPTKSVDLYAYAGTERVRRESFTASGRNYGYGSPYYVNTGCFVELSTSSCQANTSSLVEGTLGAWWRFLSGNFGTAEVGAQYEYFRRETFPGIGGSPSTDDNAVFVSFRYLPFQ